jgi:hypothetical protein
MRQDAPRQSMIDAARAAYRQSAAEARQDDAREREESRVAASFGRGTRTTPYISPGGDLGIWDRWSSPSRDRGMQAGTCGMPNATAVSVSAASNRGHEPSRQARSVPLTLGDAWPLEEPSQGQNSPVARRFHVDENSGAHTPNYEDEEQWDDDDDDDDGRGGDDDDDNPRTASAMPLCLNFMPHVDIPRFTGQIQHTQDCFLAQGFTDWPPADCESPCLFEDPSCSLPSQSAIDAASARLKFVRVTGLGEPVRRRWSESVAEVEVFATALAFLVENIDLVRGAICLTDAWVADVPANWEDEVVNRILYRQPFRIGVICKGFGGSAGSLTDNQTADNHRRLRCPVFPMDDKLVTGVVDSWTTGDDAARLCAVAMLAITIAHELVHSSGDLVPDAGTTHQPPVDDVPACSDEPRMVDSILQYTLRQRYPCIDDAPCCTYGSPPLGFGLPSNFARSDDSEPWDYANCCGTAC